MKTTFEVDANCNQQNGLRKFSLIAKMFETVEEAKECFEQVKKEMNELIKYTEGYLPKNCYIEIILSKSVWDWELPVNDITIHEYNKLETYKLCY